MTDCQNQLRVSQAGVVGLDFPAFFQVGQAKGIPPETMADLLPPIETLMLRPFREDTDGDPS